MLFTGNEPVTPFLHVSADLEGKRIFNKEKGNAILEIKKLDRNIIEKNSITK